MRRIYCLYLFANAAMVLSSCGLSIPTQPTSQTHLPTPILITPTPTFSPTQTATPTQPATLEPRQALETIQALLQKPVDCDAPCFWEIVPGQTTLRDAENVLMRLGLQIEHTVYNAQDFYGISYDVDGGLSLIATFTVRDEIVTDLRVDINPETQEMGIPRDWLAYSPETLIERYGTPSKVDFFLGGAAPDTSYAMDMYFDSKNLIIEYYSYDLGPNLQICPLIDQMSSVRIWMGADPVNPPPDSVPLEKATSLTMEEFIQLLTRDLNTACFNLNVDAF